MVIIELAEDDVPNHEPKLPQHKSKEATAPAPEAIPLETENSTNPSSNAQDPAQSGGDALQDLKPQTPEVLAAIFGDETLMAARDEASQQAIAKKKGDQHTEVEGDGWETASEGASDLDDEAKSSLDGKGATTSGNHEDHFEDALTEEQLKAKALAAANAAKVEGNNLYAAGKYTEALDCYAAAIEGIVNDPGANELRAQCYSNRAICEINLKNYKGAVQESSKALELEPNYLKALLKRAQANESLEKFEEALTDLKKVIELESGNKAARVSIIRLEPIVAQKREELKEEMIGKLKDLGNTVLGKFGMSVDDFKAVKDPNTGSYSISFGKS